jgi:Cu+-exporting ATPase
MLKDPICGMEIEDRDSVIKRKYMGKTYFFCSFSCRDAFDAEPQKYSDRNNSGLKHRYKDQWRSATNING